MPPPRVGARANRADRGARPAGSRPSFAACLEASRPRVRPQAVQGWRPYCLDFASCVCLLALKTALGGLLFLDAGVSWRHRLGGPLASPVRARGWLSGRLGSVLLESHERASVSVAELEAVDERGDDLHAATGRRFERGGLDRVAEGAEVADLYPQAAGRWLGHEEDAVVRPGLAVLHGVADRLARRERQVPCGLALETGLGGRLAYGGTRGAGAGGGGRHPCLALGRAPPAVAAAAQGDWPRAHRVAPSPRLEAARCDLSRLSSGGPSMSRFPPWRGWDAARPGRL